MPVLVFGKGLLGNCIAKTQDVSVLSREECDITSEFDVEAALEHYKPDVVINAAGLVPRNLDHQPGDAFNINSIAPQLLRYQCDRHNARLVQISSNCVFDGITGGYTEYSLPRPHDVYSATKFLGEVTDYPHLTVRCSFVGLPDTPHRGLLGWAENTLKTESEIQGWDLVKWNGVTTYELTRWLFERAVKYNLTGLIHVHSQETTTKWELLKLAQNIYGWQGNIVRESEVSTTPHVENRTLKSEFEVGVIRKSFREQLMEMNHAMGI